MDWPLPFCSLGAGQAPRGHVGSLLVADCVWGEVRVGRPGSIEMDGGPAVRAPRRGQLSLGRERRGAASVKASSACVLSGSDCAGGLC